MKDFDLQPAEDLGVPPGERPTSLRREPGALAHLVQAVGCRVVKAYFRLWHRFKVVGAEHLPPEPPYVLIANHGSHLDAMALASALPAAERSRVYPLAAGDTFFPNRPAAWVSSVLINALPVYRRRCVTQTLATLRERLLAGHSIFILFPEGTRSRTGEPGPFRAGLGRVACGTGVPIVPCWIEGAVEAAPPGTRWPRRVPIVVRIGAPFELSAFPDDRVGWEAAATEARQRVLGLRGCGGRWVDGR